MEHSFRHANQDDLPQIIDLLTGAHLPTAGVEAALNDFLLAFRNGSLVGCAGLERYGSWALLRSVAVTESERNTGLGRQLVSRLLDQAEDTGVENIVLLTTTAASYFQRFGFHTISRADVPEAVHSSPEFQGVCPASATVMQVNLKAQSSTS